MTKSQDPVAIDHNEILKRLESILIDLTSEWDTNVADLFGPNLRLIADLDFESIDVVQFVVAIEEEFGRRNLPFETLLMTEGAYTDEICVGDVADFLWLHLNKPS